MRLKQNRFCKSNLIKLHNDINSRRFDIPTTETFNKALFAIKSKKQHSNAFFVSQFQKQVYTELCRKPGGLIRDIDKNKSEFNHFFHSVFLRCFLQIVL